MLGVCGHVGRLEAPVTLLFWIVGWRLVVNAFAVLEHFERRATP